MDPDFARAAELQIMLNKAEESSGISGVFFKRLSSSFLLMPGRGV
jgi:hypothetical protein